LPKGLGLLWSLMCRLHIRDRLRLLNRRLLRSRRQDRRRLDTRRLLKRDFLCRGLHWCGRGLLGLWRGDRDGMQRRWLGIRGGRVLCARHIGDDACVAGLRQSAAFADSIKGTGGASALRGGSWAVHDSAPFQIIVANWTRSARCGAASAPQARSGCEAACALANTSRS